MKLILNLVVSTAAVLVAEYLLADISVESLVTALIVAIVLGILHTFVKPILNILTLPINILTLGLFSLVINTFLVILAGYIVPGFTVATILAAFLFSVVVAFVNSFLSSLTH